VGRTFPNDLTTLSLIPSLLHSRSTADTVEGRKEILFLPHGPPERHKSCPFPGPAPPPPFRFNHLSLPSCRCPRKVCREKIFFWLHIYSRSLPPVFLPIQGPSTDFRSPPCDVSSLSSFSTAVGRSTNCFSRTFPSLIKAENILFVARVPPFYFWLFPFLCQRKPAGSYFRRSSVVLCSSTMTRSPACCLIFINDWEVPKTIFHRLSSFNPHNHPTAALTSMMFPPPNTWVCRPLIKTVAVPFLCFLVQLEDHPLLS